MPSRHTPKIEITPLLEKAPMEGPSEMTLLIRVTPPGLQGEKTRHPINLGLVIDRSGSMSGTKIAKAREAACYCVDQLLPTDRVSVTVFDDEMDVIVPSVKASEKSAMRHRIKGVRSGGSTALHAGWLEGAKQVAGYLDPSQLNRVILLTDGQANVGVVDPATITAQAKGLFEKGVSTTTIGVGNDFNEDLLDGMGKEAGGNAWFIETAEDFPRIFGMEVEGLIREVCSRVSLKIEPAEGVKVLDVMNDFDLTPFGSWKLPALLAGDPFDIVVRLEVPGGAPGRFHCCKLTLKWDEKGERERFSIKAPVSVAYAPSAELAALEQNPEVADAGALLEAARAKRRAKEFMDEGDFASASRFLHETGIQLCMSRPAMPGSDVAEEIACLQELSKDLGEQNDLSRVRKRMTYQTAQAQRGRRDKKH